MTRNTARLPRAFRAALALAAALVVSPAGAWARDVEPGLDGSVSLEEGYTDNVRADEARREEAWYTTFEAEGEWQRHPRGWLPHRIGGLMRARVYSAFDNRDYAEFGPSFGYDWDLASLTVSYQLSPDHLRVDPAATADAFADVHNLVAELRSKFGDRKRWTAVLNLEFDAEFYDPPFRERSFYEEAVEAGLRYRLTSYLTPRGGVGFSARDAISSNFDREEIWLLAGFDVYLPADVRLIFRFEKLWRNFLVGYEEDESGDGNSNFGREDDAYTYEAGLDVPVPWIPSTMLRLRYRYRDNDSTRADRTYDINDGSLRLSYDF